ncbi:hypothetical protein ACOME3_005338 [Neoechinorhynchus agilis]
MNDGNKRPKLKVRSWDNRPRTIRMTSTNPNQRLHLNDFTGLSNWPNARGSLQHQEGLSQSIERPIQSRHSQQPNCPISEPDLYNQYMASRCSNISNRIHSRPTQPQQHLHKRTNSLVDSYRNPHAVDLHQIHPSQQRSQQLVHPPTRLSVNQYRGLARHFSRQQLPSQFVYVQPLYPNQRLHPNDFTVLSNSPNPSGSDPRQELESQSIERPIQSRHSQQPNCPISEPDLYNQFMASRCSNISNRIHSRPTQPQQHLHKRTNSLVDSYRNPHAVDQHQIHPSQQRSQQIVHPPTRLSVNQYPGLARHFSRQQLPSQFLSAPNRHLSDLNQEQVHESTTNYSSRIRQLSSLSRQSTPSITCLSHKVKSTQIDSVPNTYTDPQLITSRIFDPSKLISSGEFILHEYRDMVPEIPRRHSVQSMPNLERKYEVHADPTKNQDFSDTRVKQRNIHLINKERKRRCSLQKPGTESEGQLDNKSQAVNQESSKFQIVVYNIVATFHIVGELNVRELVKKISYAKTDEHGKILILMHYAPPGKVTFYRFGRAVVYCSGTIDQTRELAEDAVRRLAEAGVKETQIREYSLKKIQAKTDFRFKIDMYRLLNLWAKKDPITRKLSKFFYEPEISHGANVAIEEIDVKIEAYTTGKIVMNGRNYDELSKACDILYPIFKSVEL